MSNNTCTSDSPTLSGQTGPDNLPTITTHDTLEGHAVDVNHPAKSPSNESSRASHVSSTSVSTSTISSTSPETVLLPEIRASSPISRLSETIPLCESPCSLSRPSTYEGLRPAPLFQARQAANVPPCTSQEDSPPSPNSTGTDPKAEADFQRFIDWKITEWRSDLYPLQALDAQQTYCTPNTSFPTYKPPTSPNNAAPPHKPYFEWLPRAHEKLDPHDPIAIGTNAAAESQRQRFWAWKKAQWRREDAVETPFDHGVDRDRVAATDATQIFRDEPSSRPTRRLSHRGQDAVDMNVKWQCVRKAFWDNRRQLWREQGARVRREEGYDRTKHWWPEKANVRGRVQRVEGCPTRAVGREDDEVVLAKGGREGVNVFHAVERGREGVKDLAGVEGVQRRVFWAGKREEWGKRERENGNEEGLVVRGEKEGDEEEQEMLRKVKEWGFRICRKEIEDDDEGEGEWLVGKGKVRRGNAGGLFLRPDEPRRWDGRAR